MVTSQTQHLDPASTLILSKLVMIAIVGSRPSREILKPSRALAANNIDVVTTRMISQLEGRQEQMKVLWSDLEVIGVWLQHVTRNGIRRMRENYDKVREYIIDHTLR